MIKILFKDKTHKAAYILYDNRMNIIYEPINITG